MKLLLGILLAAATHAGDPPHLDDVVRELARLESSRGVAAVRAGLVDLGPAAVPALMHVLTGRPITGTEGAPILCEETRSLLIDVLRELPAGRVSRALQDAALRGEPADRRTAWALIAELGDASILLDLLEANPLADPNRLRDPRLAGALERATLTALRRDPRAIRLLDTRLMRTPDAVLPPVVRALGRTESLETTPILVGLLGRDAGIDSVVLAALSEGTRAPCADEEARGAVRSFLDSEDPLLLRLAVGTLGDMRDAAVIDEILEHLDAEDRRLVQASRGALVHMTGLDLGADPAVWASWLAGQRAWRAEHGSALEEAAVDASPEIALRAIRTLSSRPLFAREHARILARALEHADEGVAAAAAAGLQRLGVGEALTDLVAALDDPRPRVRVAAHRALETLTGRLLEPDELAWRGVLPR